MSSFFLLFVNWLIGPTTTASHGVPLDTAFDVRVVPSVKCRVLDAGHLLPIFSNESVQKVLSSFLRENRDVLKLSSFLRAI